MLKNHRFIFCISILIGILVLGVTVLVIKDSPEPVKADTQPRPAETWTTCTIANVAVFNSRIHVKCSNPVGSIVYFAYPTGGSNATQANLYLNILLTAYTQRKTVDVAFDESDLSGSAYGCANSDCRPIQGVIIKP